MSESPNIPKKGSYPTTLKPGTYFWCSCGKSQSQPFCDGEHKGTSFTPIKYECKEEKTVYFCGCKHSEKSPLCDGSHSKLP